MFKNPSLSGKGEVELSTDNGWTDSEALLHLHDALEGPAYTYAGGDSREEIIGLFAPGITGERELTYT